MTYLERESEDFKASFCPYGCLDIRKAVVEALGAGKDGNWAFEQLEEFAESCDMKITDLDPCYVVMDSVLQIVRNEIGENATINFQINGYSNFFFQQDNLFSFLCIPFEWSEIPYTETIFIDPLHMLHFNRSRTIRGLPIDHARSHHSKGFRFDTCILNIPHSNLTKCYMCIPQII